MLEKEMIKLGLSDKEAKVYLASLELGPSTAQIISQKAGVNRATTYVIIESLMKMGLMSTYDEGKKTFFVAGSPEKLLEFLSDQEKQVREKLEILKNIMPQLNSMVKTKKDDWEIKYFTGENAMEKIRELSSDRSNQSEKNNIFQGEIIISGNKVLFVDRKNETEVFVIESNALSNNLSTCFRAMGEYKNKDVLAKRNDTDRVE